MKIRSLCELGFCHLDYTTLQYKSLLVQDKSGTYVISAFPKKTLNLTSSINKGRSSP